MSKIEKPVKKPTGYDMKDWADNDYLQENIDALVYCKDIRWEKYIEQSDKYWEQEMNKKDAEIAELITEVNSAFKQGSYEGYKDGFENGQNDERS